MPAARAPPHGRLASPRVSSGSGVPYGGKDGGDDDDDDSGDWIRRRSTLDGSRAENRLRFLVRGFVGTVVVSSHRTLCSSTISDASSLELLRALALDRE